MGNCKDLYKVLFLKLGGGYTKNSLLVFTLHINITRANLEKTKKEGREGETFYV